MKEREERKQCEGWDEEDLERSNITGTVLYEKKAEKSNKKSAYSKYLNIWRNWPGIIRFWVSFMLMYS